MRKGVRKQRLIFGHASRDIGGGRSAFVRLASYMLCLLLVLQVSVAAHHSSRVGSAPNSKEAVLASLGAAIGQPVTLCEHDGDPGDPADRATCEHCVFCHSVASGVATDLSSSPAVTRLSTVTATSRPRGDVAFVRERYAGNATPRGPPALG